MSSFDFFSHRWSESVRLIDKLGKPPGASCVIQNDDLISRFERKVIFCSGFIWIQRLKKSQIKYFFKDNRVVKKISYQKSRT